MAHIREVEQKDGKTRFVVRWRENGQERQTTKATRRQAEREALRIEDKIARGESTQGHYKPRETVADVVEKVMASSERKLKRGTALGYQRLYDRRILPKFGQRKIASIDSQEVERWIEELIAEGLAPATVRHCHIALSKVFKYAVRHKIVQANPCQGTELPSIRKDNDHATFLLPSQVASISDALADWYPYDLLVRFAAGTGLRAAEIAGLRVGDVDVHKREVRVEQTLSRIDGEPVPDTPKSARSTRTVPLLQGDLVRDLAAFLLQHPRSSDPEAYFWPGRKVGGTHELDYGRPFHHASFYGWHFKPALVRAGLLGEIKPQTDGTFAVGCCDKEYFTAAEAARHVAGHLGKGGPRFHDLRHTAASSWIAAGIDIYKVSRWLGHSTIAITFDIYGHLIPGDYEDDSARVEAWMERAQRL